MLTWRFERFDNLAPRDLHDIFRARIEVFVIEQACLFQGIDGTDPSGWHLMGRTDGQEELVAYCRILPPGVKYPEPTIGRVLTTAAVRGTGAGRELMREALARTQALWPDRAVRIGAQQRLERFYQEMGFEPCSEPYDEDGIQHIEMLLKRGKS